MWLSDHTSPLPRVVVFPCLTVENGREYCIVVCMFECVCVCVEREREREKERRRERICVCMCVCVCALSIFGWCLVSNDEHSMALGTSPVPSSPPDHSFSPPPPCKRPSIPFILSSPRHKHINAHTHTHAHSHTHLQGQSLSHKTQIIASSPPPCFSQGRSYSRFSFTGLMV